MINWDTLSMQQKNDIISNAVAAGITDLDTIRSNADLYARITNKFSGGGNTKKPLASPMLRAMGYLMTKGMSLTGAAAMVGVLFAESGLDPTIHARMKGDTGEGIALWTDNKSGSRKNVFWNTLERIEAGARKKYGSISKVPLERLLDVVLNERPEITRAISDADTLERATDIMLRGYENGGGNLKTMASRLTMDSIYGKWNNGYARLIDTRIKHALKVMGLNPMSYMNLYRVAPLDRLKVHVPRATLQTINLEFGDPNRSEEKTDAILVEKIETPLERMSRLHASNYSQPILYGMEELLEGSTEPNSSSNFMDDYNKYLNIQNNYGALGGIINKNNPILNYSYYKGGIPKVRFDKGGPLSEEEANEIKQLIASEWPATTNVLYGLLQQPELVMMWDDKGNPRGTIETIVPLSAAMTWSPFLKEWEPEYDPKKINYFEDFNRVDYRDRNEYGEPIGEVQDGKNYLRTNSPGLPTVVYNPKYTTTEDIKLDLLHVMHNDPIYEGLYNSYFTEAINDPKFLYNDSMSQGISPQALDGYLGGKYADHYSEEAAEIDGQVLNLLDGYLRSQFYPGTPETRVERGYDEFPFDTSYNAGLSKSIANIRNYLETNKHANGGNLFATGGPEGFINPYKGGEGYTDSDQCAYFMNHTLNDNGFMVSGNAWLPRGVDVIFSGYDGLTKPEKYSREALEAYNSLATQNVYDNFITKDNLSPDSVYTVNMFYKGSPSQEDAYKEGKRVTGTHTGYLSYDKDTDKWMVTHNIHGKVYREPFGQLQNSKGNWGVTAIYQPREAGVFNRIKTALGFADGGPLVKAANRYYIV